METAGTAKKLDMSDWLLTLTRSVQEVFETMLSTKVAPVCEASKTVRLDWTAMVGLAGQLHGIVTFSCDEKAAIRITSKMLGVEVKEADERVYDAVGEVCNMIAGNFKHQISELTDDCSLSPPTVVVGTDYRLYRVAAGSVTSFQLTFTFDGIPVFTRLDVRK